METMLELKDKVGQTWENESPDSAMELVEDHYGADELDDVAGDQMFRSRDAFYEDLTRALTEAETDELTQHHIVDALSEVQASDAPYFDVGVGMLRFREMDLADAMEVIDQLQDERGTD